MTFDHHTDKKKRAEKAAALLTLAKLAGEPPGPCPSDEELAAMVDGRTGRDEQARFREHLSRCSKCYDAWLLLTRLKEHEARRGRIFRLKRLSRFSFVGSALAAAASVAIYLNIVRFEEPDGDMSLQESKVAEQPAEVASPPQQAKKEAAVVEPERTAAKAKASMPAAPAPSAFRAPQEMDKSVSWLQRIEEGCLAGRQEPEFWAELRLQGEDELAESSGAPQTHDSKRIEAVLLLLQGMESSESVARQCRLILDELAKNGRSR
jgi:cell division septation protein DedD